MTKGERCGEEEGQALVYSRAFPLIRSAEQAVGVVARTSFSAAKSPEPTSDAS